MKNLLILLLLLILLTDLTFAKSFVIYNVSNPSQTYFIVSGQTGYVGIGTSSPGYPLDVVGSGKFSENLIVSGYIDVSSLRIGGTEVIDSSRNLKNINRIDQDLIPTSNNTYDLGADLIRWRNGYFSGDLYVAGTIHGDVEGDVTTSGDLDMQGNSIINAQDVNASRFFQSGKRVIDTITAGNGLTGGGSGPSVTLDVNVNTNKGLQIVSDALEVKIGTGLAFDGSGNIYVKYGDTSGTAVEGDTQISINAGSGLTGGGTITLGAGGSVTISHDDTSTQSSVTNTGGVVIQSIGLDDYGHVISISSVDLDNRYYTETEADSRFANVNGEETISAKWTFNEDVKFMKNIYVAGNISYVNQQVLNVNGSIIPPLDDWFDIGSSSKRWKDAYFAGTVNAGTINANTLNVGSTTYSGDLDMNNNDILHIGYAYFGSNNDAYLTWDGTYLTASPNFNAPTIYQNGNQVLDTSTTFSAASGSDATVSGTYNNLDIQIKAGVIGTNELADNAVTSAKIADGTITSSDIDDSVVYVSVQDGGGAQQFTVTDGNNALRIAAGDGVSITFDPSTHKVTIADSNAGNEIQSDSATFNIRFTLEQTEPWP